MNGQWQRMNPLSPLVRAAGALAAVVVLGAGQLERSQPHTSPYAFVIWTVLLLAGAVSGFIAWLVTRWRINGSDLQIETGLIRRQSLRIPLERIQAVDVVAPLVARILGLAEVRVVSAGGGVERSRLAYLRETHAQAVRAQLLALAHGLEPTAAPPADHLLYEVDNARLVGGMLLRAPALPVLVALALGIAIAVAVPVYAAPALTLVVFMVSAFLGLFLRPVNADWSFRLSESLDGFRLDRGLLQTRHETIPFGRIQGVRIWQPMLWRALGWYAVSVDVARQKVATTADSEAQQVARWLAPVANRAQVNWIVSRALPGAVVDAPEGSRPPSRSFWAIPFTRPNAATWFDDNYLFARTGRVAPRTSIVPHAKVQSVRLRRGPLLRLLGLSDLFADAAGSRRTGGSVRGLARDASEAQEWAWQWTELTRRRRGDLRASAG
jgi:putative membrane protein